MECIMNHDILTEISLTEIRMDSKNDLTGRFPKVHKFYVEDTHVQLKFESS